MPLGALLVYGSGIRLQPTTPGVADSGHEHITGTVATDSWFTNLDGSRANVYHGSRNLSGGPGTATNSNNVWIGHAIDMYGTCTNSVVIGFNARIGAGGSASGVSVVAIGAFAVAGLAAGSLGGDIAIGRGATAIRAAGAYAHNITIGANSQINAGDGSILICTDGANLNLGQDNVIAIGNRMSAYLVGSNRVIIGNTLQTVVQVGAYTIGQSSGTSLTVADASVVLTDEGRILYSSITAARTVTLQAANAVPPGYIVQIVDMSGAASGTNTITAVPAGADTIPGPGTPVINSAYGSISLMSDGVSLWNVKNTF